MGPSAFSIVRRFSIAWQCKDVTMSNRVLSRRRFIGFLFCTVAITATGLWVKRDRIIAWCCVYQLTHAEASQRDYWVNQTANLGSASLNELVAALKEPSEQVCEGVEAA